MPTTVACPECGTKLRLPDGLSGQEVKCARCSAVFVVAAGANDAAAESPLREIDRPFPPPPPRPAATNEDPAPALNLSLDDPADPTARPRERGQEPRSFPRPALNDNHDDLIRCPSCGKQTHRDSRRCRYCGERLSRAGKPPLFTRGDAEPHRGGLVLTLGIIGLLTSFCPLIGLVFGIATLAIGHSDLAKMQRGQMDPDGEDITRGGWICALIATAIGLLTTLGCGAIGATAIFAAKNAPVRIAPPPQVRPLRR